MDPALNPYQPPVEMVSGEPSGSTVGLDADRWARFWGAVIDAVASLALILPLQSALGRYDESGNPTGTAGQDALWGAAGFAIWLLLHGYFVARGGQTIGKRLLGTRVVNIADGQPASFTRIALLRELPLHLLAMLPALTYVAAFAAVVDALINYRANRRCLHDHVAGTRVAKLR